MIEKDRGLAFRELEEKVHNRLPVCRAFVSGFWGVGENLADAGRITISEGTGGRSSACVHPHSRELVLFAGPDLKKPEKMDRLLIHELTHLVSLAFMDMEKEECMSVAEGLASLATDAYLSEDHVFSKDKMRYFRGKRFVRALYDGGVAPHQMHGLLRLGPTLNELFFPSRYLDRAGLPYDIENRAGPVDVRLWLEHAVKSGHESIKKGIGCQQESGALAFLEGHPAWRLREPKGMPGHLLHDPHMYGANFAGWLAGYYKSIEKALSIIRKHNPADMARHPWDVSHIIEPWRYVLGVQKLELSRP